MPEEEAPPRSGTNVGIDVGVSFPPRVGISVGDKVGVERSRTGDVPTGVIVGKVPEPIGVSGIEERGGFCQM